MQNPMQKYRQSSNVFEKPGILSKNWKFWRAPTTIEFNNFCWNFAHIFYISMPARGCSGFFKFYLDLKLFKKKIKQDLVYTHSQKPGFSITQDLDKFKIIPNTLF